MSTNLISCGLEDVAVVSCPETSLFVHNYLRHTHFIKALIEISPSGSTSFNKTITFNIPKHADLMTYLWLVVVRPGIEPDRRNGCTAVYWTNAWAHALINRMDFIIGAHTAETRYGEWMEIYDEITYNFNQSRAEFSGQRYTVEQLKQDSMSDKRLYIDTQFWFTKNPGLALPLLCVALQSVRLQLYTRSLNELVVCEGNRFAAPLRVGQQQVVRDSDICLTAYAQVIYLTQDERDAILERENEFLFEQVQTTGPISYNASGSSGACVIRVPLDFCHLIRSLYWTVQQECKNEANNWFSYDGIGGQDPVVSVDLKLNNTSMFQQKEGSYFRLVEYRETERLVPLKHIYKKAFDLKSWSTNPNGHLNFTRLENNSLNLVLQPNIGPICVTVWARGWNCMRFCSGVGGPLFT